MTKSNLLFISPVSPTPDGIGLAIRAYNNLVVLSEFHHVYLLVMPPGRRDSLLHPRVIHLCRGLKKVFLHPVKDFWLCLELLLRKILKCLKLKEDVSPQEWTSLSKKRVRRGYRAFKGIDFSVIHVFRLYMVPAAEPFLNQFDGVTGLDLDDVESVTRMDIGRLYRKNGRLKDAEDCERQAHFYLEREYIELHRFHKIYVCSSKDKEFISNQYGHPDVTVLPNVAELPDISIGHADLRRPIRFFFCGNFFYYPNIDGLTYFLDEILPLILESPTRDFIVDVVGQGLKGELKQRVLQDSRLIYHGSVADIRPFLQRADAILAPIRAGGGTRIKILEGLAHGKPVISTHKGAEGIPAQHNMEIALAKDSEEFARHCLEFLEDPRKWKNLGDRGRELIGMSFSLDCIREILSRYTGMPNKGLAGMPTVEGKVDVVYTWVDGSTTEFKQVLKKELNRSGLPVSNGWNNRFRDNQELRYSLRSLETYAPWTGHIYLVTSGQTPSWLRQDHPRISIIDHHKIFPDMKYLPTFNSNAIELCLHRIPGLSNRFLYLNDDLFFGNVSSLNDFTTASGGIRFYQEPIMISTLEGSNSVLDQSYLYSQVTLQKLFGSKRNGLLPAHTPQLYDRDMIKKLQHLLSDEFIQTIGNRFRSPDDLVLRIIFYHYLLKSPDPKSYRHMAIPLSWESKAFTFWMLGRRFFKNLQVFLHILRRRPKFFCINDDIETNARYHPGHLLLRLFLGWYFPRKSSFER